MTYSRVALLRGCNKYLNYPDKTLGGCVNDAKDMQEFLIDNLQMNYDNTTLLLDEDSTWQGTDRALMMMLEHSERLDRIYFISSGHGTDAPSPTEPDGKQGALVVYDTHDLPRKDEIDPSSLYLESWLMGHLAVVPPACLFECWLDHCEAGEFAEPGIRGRGHTRFLSRLLRDRPETVVVWTACGPTEYSAEYYLDGRSRGAFLWAFRKSYQPGLNRRQVLEATTNLLEREGFKQHPMLLCSEELAGLAVGEI